MAVLDNDFLIPGTSSYLGKRQNGHWFIGTAENSTKLFQANSFKDRLMAAWYQAREDERLGRFRLPDVPDKVAYKGSYEGVRIVDETDGSSRPYMEDARPADAGLKKLLAAAFEHFYPEPEKPWMDAKVGSVWAVKEYENSEEFAATFTESGDFEGAYDTYYKNYYKDWFSARQIWPEVAE